MCCIKEIKKVGIAIFKRLLLLLFIILLGIWTKPLWEDPVRDIIPDAVSDAFSSASDFVTEAIDNDFYFRQVADEATSLLIPLQVQKRIGSMNK